MLVATDVFGNQVLAWRVPLFAQWEYFCPECEDAVFIKDGPLKIAHFSHYASSTCGYGTGEGARHVALKMAAMQAFERFEGVEFERVVIPGRRADIVVPETRVVIECQASALDYREWISRTADYSEAGYSVLWVWDRARFDLQHNPKEILLCHRACYGQVTVCDPESGGWYSAHFHKTNAYGNYVRARFRVAEFMSLPDEVELIKARNDGLHVANLMMPWWTRRKSPA